MEGSALRGDMVGGATPVDMEVEIVADAPDESIARIVDLANRTSPAEAYMKDRLRNTFTLTANGTRLELTDLWQSERQVPDPATRFDDLKPATGRFLPDIITKVAEAGVVHGVEGGAGSSLQTVQKRTLHVRGEARLLESGLKEIQVSLLQPIGSTFRFLSDDSDEQEAPPAMAYLSAGIGFCFMTQLSRYAHITKKKLESCRVVQFNVLRSADQPDALTAEPVDTHVFITLDEPPDVAKKMVWMGERTCFLHAAMRGANPTRVRVGECR